MSPERRPVDGRVRLLRLKPKAAKLPCVSPRALKSPSAACVRYGPQASISESRTAREGGITRQGVHLHNSLIAAVLLMAAMEFAVSADGAGTKHQEEIVRDFLKSFEAGTAAPCRQQASRETGTESSEHEQGESYERDSQFQVTGIEVCAVAAVGGRCSDRPRRRGRSRRRAVHRGIETR